jgi:Raf kinase inhibitor-like YbhB/YbcL family protein
MTKKAVTTGLVLGGLILLGGILARAASGKAVLQVSSPAFKGGQAIPAKYTCDGADLSPPLTWSGGPPNTKSWALICEDPDAPNGPFTHWVVWGHPASVTQLAEGASSNGSLSQSARQGMNDFNRVGYGGPCPPPGKAHRYFFKLYALDTELALKAQATKRELLKAMDTHVIAEGSWVGTYQRNR